jgi:hypothetical protein
MGVPLQRALGATDEQLPELCMKAYQGSPWAALKVAVHVKAKSLDELVRVVGLGPATPRREGFDAVADAWHIYCDAIDSGANF